jgi:hypothetical protein
MTCTLVASDSDPSPVPSPVPPWSFSLVSPLATFRVPSDSERPFSLSSSTIGGGILCLTAKVADLYNGKYTARATNIIATLAPTATPMVAAFESPFLLFPLACADVVVAGAELVVGEDKVVEVGVAALMLQ